MEMHDVEVEPVPPGRQDKRTEPPHATYHRHDGWPFNKTANLTNTQGGGLSSQQK